MQRRHFLKNNSGSAALSAAIVASVVALGFSYFSVHLINQSKLNKNFQTLIDNEIVLNSIVDYTTTGIQQRWCFSKTWLRDIQCDLSHERNVERLLLNSKSLAAIKDMRSRGVPIKVGSPIDLSSIVHEIPVKGMSSRHPLYKITNHLKTINVESIKIAIQRIENDIIFSKGSEVYLSVEVTLKVSKAAGVGSHRLKSTILMMPREVSSFALVVANDLKIGTNTGLKIGDSSIPSGSSDGPGLIFDSPIFVNGNVVISQSSYTPVTFTENIFTGNGILKLGGSPYVPKSNGGLEDRFYSDIESIGGFKKGITLTGQRDIGLDYFSGQKTPQQPNSDLMKQCIKMSMAGSDLFMTSRSSLAARKLSSNAFENTHNILLGLSLWNRFTAQETYSASVRQEDGKFWKTANLSKESASSIVEVNIKVGDDHQVRATLAKDQTLTVKPRFSKIDDPEKAIEKLNNEIIKQRNDISKIDDAIDRTNKTIRDYDLKIASLFAKLSVAKKKKEKEKIRDEIEDYKDKKEDLEEDIKDDLKKKSALEASVRSKQAQIASMAKDVEEHENNPEITLKVTDRKMKSFDQFNQLKLNVDFNNGKTFDTSKVEISVKAFDIGTENGSDMRVYSGDDATGFPGYAKSLNLEFEKSGSSGSFNMKTNLSTLTWKSPESTKRIEDPVDMSFNYGELEKKCEDPDSGFSFESTSWDISFADQSRSSWTFADPFDGTWNITKLEAGPQPTFKVRSLVKNCIVKSDAEFVTGFMTCDRFEIQARSKPLKIVGTVVTNKLVIAPAALKAGIWWSTIYHPQAVKALQDADVLNPMGGGDCKRLSDPIWHPNPSLVNLSNHYKCNPLSLREKANPFSWTSVDPDCGIIDFKANRTSCKFRPKNFILKEIGRGAE